MTFDQSWGGDDSTGTLEFRAERDPVDELQEFRDWGVDLSLIEASLARTPTERIRKMLALMRLGDELRRAYAERFRTIAPSPTRRE
jgi:hypothetical protein